MKSNRFAMIVTGIIMIAIMLWFVVSGVTALTKSGSVPPDRAQKGDLCEFTAEYAGKVFDFTTEAVVVPIGKEDFYLMDSEDGMVRFIVRAKPSWINKHFAEDGSAKEGLAKVKGDVKRMDEDLSKIVRELNNGYVEKGLLTADNGINTIYFIDVRYKEFGWVRIIAGVVFFGVGVLVRLAMANGMLQKKPIKVVYGAALLGVAVLVLYTFRVGKF